MDRQNIAWIMDRDGLASGRNRPEGPPRDRGPEHGSVRQRRRKGESRPGFIGPLVDGTNKSNESIRTHNELPILIGALHRLGVPLLCKGWARHVANNRKLKGI
jgi:hypothetical protein